MGLIEGSAHRWGTGGTARGYPTQVGGFGTACNAELVVALSLELEDVGSAIEHHWCHLQ